MKGKCLICKKAAKRLSRGLCGKHYIQYYRMVSTLPEAQKEKFDQQLISKGMLAKSIARGPRIRNVFAEDLKKFLEKSKDSKDPSTSRSTRGLK